MKKENSSPTSGRNNATLEFFVLLLLLMAVFSLAILPQQSSAEPFDPSGPSGVEYSGNYTRDPIGGSSQNASGGSIHVLNIVAENNNPYWKGYVGNVTGSLVLGDNSNNSIFNWPISVPNGEVYASRSPDIDWASIECANETEIGGEDQTLGLNVSKDFSVNATFNATSHEAFYAGSSFISQDSCSSASTNAFNTTSNFDELLLSDSTNDMVYTTLINDDGIGFNNRTYDYQMILPEDYDTESQTAYYFYAELD